MSTTIEFTIRFNPLTIVPDTLLVLFFAWVTLYRLGMEVVERVIPLNPVSVMILAMVHGIVYVLIIPEIDFPDLYLTPVQTLLLFNYYLLYGVYAVALFLSQESSNRTFYRTRSKQIEKYIKRTNEIYGRH